MWCYSISGARLLLLLFWPRDCVLHFPPALWTSKLQQSPALTDNKGTMVYLLCLYSLILKWVINVSLQHWPLYMLFHACSVLSILTSWLQYYFQWGLKNMLISNIILKYSNKVTARGGVFWESEKYFASLIFHVCRVTLFRCRSPAVYLPQRLKKVPALISLYPSSFAYPQT